MQGHLLLPRHWPVSPLRYVGKAILAAIVTLIVGYLGMVVGLEFLGDWVEFGLLIAIAVMGAFIIYFNDKKK